MKVIGTYMRVATVSYMHVSRQNITVTNICLLSECHSHINVSCHNFTATDIYISVATVPLSRDIIILQPSSDNALTVTVSGVTVYDLAHSGSV